MNWTPEQIVRGLGEHLTPERQEKIARVVSQRSSHVMALMENIYDRGNVSAVMRSSEAFGFHKICLVDKPGAKFKAANRVTRGAEKWLKIQNFSEPSAACADLKAQGYQIWATDLNTQTSVDEVPWQKPIAVVFGNEKEGVSNEMLNLVDGRFRIPMAGFSQSFNISVAAALIFFHARRQLQAVRQLTAPEQHELTALYYWRCFDNPDALMNQKLGHLS